MVPPCVARIIGVDLSAQTAKTDAFLFTFHADGTLRADFQPKRPTNRRSRPPIDDSWLLAWTASQASPADSSAVPTVIGIDAPFGWPTAFLGAVDAWMGERHAWPKWDRPRQELRPADASSWDEPAEFLAYRTTDRFVRYWRRRERGATREDWPDGISVAAEKIAVTAFRAARILTATRGANRDGMSGSVLEVYPGSALAEWGAYRDYRSTADAAGELISECIRPGLERLGAESSIDPAPALEALAPDGAIGQRMRERHHVFDAAVAALTTWAAVVGETFPPPGGSDVDDQVTRFLVEENRRRAAIVGLGEATPASVHAEGWIHHPRSLPVEFLGLDPVPQIIRRYEALP